MLSLYSHGNNSFKNRGNDDFYGYILGDLINVNNFCNNYV
jgi:hypothetical protein